MARTGLGVTGTCLSVFPTLPPSRALGRTSSASELFKDWGERWPGCRPRRGTRQAAGAKGLVPASQRGKERSRHPGRETEQDAAPHQQPPPGQPQLAARLILCSWQGPRRLQGSVGGCHSVPNPMGHRAIYLEVSPPRPSLHFRKSALYARLPPPSPPQGFEEEGDLHPPWYQGTAACCPFPQPPRSYFC